MIKSGLAWDVGNWEVARFLVDDWSDGGLLLDFCNMPLDLEGIRMTVAGAFRRGLGQLDNLQSFALSLDPVLVDKQRWTLHLIKEV